MNIFDVLSQGKSRLHEPSISAMLGYLLDSRRDHGLGDSFLRAFCDLLNQHIESRELTSILSGSFIQAEVDLEEPYELNGSRKDIDIQVRVLDEQKQERIRFIVENKIKVGAASAKQLRDYYLAVTGNEELSNLVIVFLTPRSQGARLQEEFDALSELMEGHHKVWIYWNGEQSILEIIRSILIKEILAEIPPINDYMRHTLKAFVLHVESVVEQGRTGVYRFGEDIGKIMDEVTAGVGENIYRITRRDSGQIQMYKEDEKVVAKPILREIIREYGFEIPTHSRAKGVSDGLNTREMGRRVINAIKQREGRVE